jgi:hypothetical protein
VTSLSSEPVLKTLLLTVLSWVSDLLLPVLSVLALLSYLSGGLGCTSLNSGTSWFSSLQSKTQTFNLNLQDANALSQGSPVRFIGVPVGQVDRVWIDGEGAHVKVRLKKQALAIPLGAKASVVSFGLAGNRSVEFEPPAVTDTTASLLAGVTPSSLQAASAREGNRAFSPYEVEESIRLGETMKIQLQVARILQVGADNMNAGLFQTPVPQLKRSIHNNRLALQQTLLGQQQFLRETKGRQQEYHAVTQHITALVHLFESSAQNVTAGLNASEALDKVYLQKQMRGIRQGLDSFDKFKLDKPSLFHPPQEDTTLSKEAPVQENEEATPPL